MPQHPTFGTFVLLIATANALVYPHSEATTLPPSIPKDAWSPTPTQAIVLPTFGAVRQRDLFGRQQTILDTCGYTDGDVNAPFTCAGVCSSFINDFINCCPTATGGNPQPDCYPATSCLDYADTDNYTGEVVLFADQTLLCPSGAPSCITSYVYGANTDAQTTLTTYWCDTTETTISIYQAPTAQAATDTQTVTFTPAVNSSTSISASTLRQSSPGETSSSSTSASATATGSASATTTESTPTGAIAGGVVGGIAVLISVVLVIWLLRRRKRKEREAAMPEIGR